MDSAVYIIQQVWSDSLLDIIGGSCTTWLFWCNWLYTV